MYKKITHPERPLILHVFIEEPVSAIFPKLKIQKKFKVEDYVNPDPTDIALFVSIHDIKAYNGIIWIKKSLSAVNPSVIAHEAFHAVVDHFSKLNMNLNDSSEESYAYMLDYLVGKIYSLSKKQK